MNFSRDGFGTTSVMTNDTQVDISYSCAIATKSILQPLSSWWAPNILGSWNLPFRITWRHRSCDHSIPHRLFPVCFLRQFFSKTHI